MRTISDLLALPNSFCQAAFLFGYQSLKARGGSGVIFACLAHMKVLFIAEQPLFKELRYRAVSNRYGPLEVSRRTAFLQKYIEEIWSKFGLYFSVIGS